jgi:hypothetical protein
MKTGMLVEDPDRDQLRAAVERATRRVRLNQVLAEAGWAGAIALLGPVLLLLAGSQWFRAPLLLLFVAAGGAFAGWRLYRRRPAAYEVSQILDARLHTQDQISTAVYYLDGATVAAVEQRHAAAKLAAGASIEEAVPVSAPRSLYALAAVFLVASTLWAIRFFLERPLQLDQPLARVVRQALSPSQPRPKQPQAASEQLQAKVRPEAIPFDEPETLVSAERQPGEDPTRASTAAVPDPEAGPQPDASRSPDEAAAGDPLGDPIPSDEMPIQSYEDMLERDAKSGLSKAEGKQGGQQDSSGNSNQSSGDSEASSLLAKLREAMNNMLSRMQQKPSGAGKQQQAQAGSPSNAGEPQEGQGEGQTGAGQAQPGGQQASEGEGADADQQSAGAGAAAKAGAKGAEGGQKGSSGDGAGSQEGDKNILDAQQQEALGKLTELYGRRAQNVTGEVTVEAQPGKQSLRTPLSAKQGAHRDSGGQVSRDEIPLAYQAYIKEYFSKIRQAEKK